MFNLKNFFASETDLPLINQRGQSYTVIYHKLKKLYSQKKVLTAFFEQNRMRIKKLAQLIATNQSTLLRAEAVYLKKINQQIKQFGTVLNTILHSELQQIPNTIHKSVPVGDATHNQIVRQKLDYPNQTFNQIQQRQFLEHITILKQIGGLETTKTVLMSQPRFATYQGLAAQLLRCLQNFLFDYHTQNHYLEINAPALINETALLHTGQLPKARNDCYKLENSNLYLSPTAEVTLINLFRKRLFQSQELPFKVAAYSPCFRKEAGAAGQDTRGIIRLHQFHKIELVQFCHPDRSYADLEKFVNEVSHILEQLHIPYRVVNLASAELAFQSAKTYDLEVWWPSQKKFLEISSISNTESFQTTSLQIKLLLNSQTKAYVHALNGSGLALDRLLAIIVEYAYLPATQSFQWPQPLRKYLPSMH